MAIPFLGWFVGIVLVTASRAWTGREKAVGIALVLLPAVLLALGFVAVSADGSEVTQVGATPGEEGGNGSSSLGPLELAVILGTFFAGPLSAVYLGSRLRRPEEPAELASA